MSDNTKIQWTDATWSPIVGCSKTSPGCAHCYAERMACRLARMGQHKYAEVTAGDRWNERTYLDEATLVQPMRWRKPRRIFVCSMGDIFHESVPDERIAAVFGVIAACPQHAFQVLTKRPQRMRRWFAWVESRYCGPGARDRPWLHPPFFCAAKALDCRCDVKRLCDEIQWPFPNAWLGTTVESADYRQRIDELRATPAAVRFLSLEPLLGPLPDLDLHGIDWVIVGGESGPGARPMHPDWARSIRDQCEAAGVVYFFKQWGEWAPLEGSGAGEPTASCFWRNGEWRSGLTVEDTAHMVRIGKRHAGRLLDGRTHDAMPGVGHA